MTDYTYQDPFSLEPLFGRCTGGASARIGTPLPVVPPGGSILTIPLPKVGINTGGSIPLPKVGINTGGGNIIVRPLGTVGIPTGGGVVVQRLEAQ